MAGAGRSSSPTSSCPRTVRTLLAGRTASSRWRVCWSSGISTGCPASHIRSGTGSTHSAFGLSLALPFARTLADRGEPDLLATITDSAMGWFWKDRDYPAQWEPSGWDFLSAALTEAELMASLLPEDEFSAWLD